MLGIRNRVGVVDLVSVVLLWVVFGTNIWGTIFAPASMWYSLGVVFACVWFDTRPDDFLYFVKHLDRRLWAKWIAPKGSMLSLVYHPLTLWSIRIDWTCPLIWWQNWDYGLSWMIFFRKSELDDIVKQIHLQGKTIWYSTGREYHQRKTDHRRSVENAPKKQRRFKQWPKKKQSSFNFNAIQIVLKASLFHQLKQQICSMYQRKDAERRSIWVTVNE